MSFVTTLGRVYFYDSDAFGWEQYKNVHCTDPRGSIYFQLWEKE